jgi:hypothetical protein
VEKELKEEVSRDSEASLYLERGQPIPMRVPREEEVRQEGSLLPELVVTPSPQCTTQEYSSL